MCVVIFLLQKTAAGEIVPDYLFSSLLQARV